MAKLSARPNMPSASESARGRWPELLRTFGLTDRELSGRHGPCPMCGGTDRFRFDNRNGRGTFFCAHCGAGDGFTLLQRIKDWQFRRAADEIERIVGTIRGTTPPPNAPKTSALEACRRLWSASSKVADGDPVHRYLVARTGATTIPACIRFHPGLEYRHEDGNVTAYPAMLARIRDEQDRSVALHRTYLTIDGRKAPVPCPKKLLGKIPASSAIHLFPVAAALGIAEGIETAMSAAMKFDLPVWAAISAGGLERWNPPKGTERVVVFGDNDISGTGQAAAWNLAKRLIGRRIDVEVRIPEMRGKDWNDVLENLGKKDANRTSSNGTHRTGATRRTLPAIVREVESDED